MWLSLLPLLIVYSDDAETSTVSHQVPEVPHPDKSVESGVAPGDREPDQKSTVSTAAKLLCGVRDSTNTFVPLKSIAKSLYTILENRQVWSPACTLLTVLIVISANRGGCAGHRIVSTQDQSAFKFIVCTNPPRGC